MNREELLTKYADPIPVLDHGGVKLLDVMGGDYAIVQSARVSYGHELDDANQRDARRLIRYMMKHHHGTPFESCEIKLWVHLPIFVERQWARHRTAHWNELSGRYSELPEEFYVPPPEQVCYQSGENKQGRSGPLEPTVANHHRSNMRALCGDAFAGYHNLLEVGIAKETARLGLPVSTYTTKVWKVDLRNLLGFLLLRLDPHAQWEIRQYAEVIWTIVQDWVPLAAEAFRDYELEAITLSRQEVAALRELLSSHDLLAHPDVGMTFDRAGLTGREREEFAAKLGLNCGPSKENR